MTATNFPAPGRYRHYKGGEYEVLFVGYHSENLEEMVIYRALQPSAEFPLGVWVRPLSMFIGTVELTEHGRQRQVARFTAI